MKKVMMMIAAMLLSVTISAQDMGGMGPGPGGMPPGGMGPGGMGPGGPRGERPKKDGKDKKKKEKQLSEKQLAKIREKEAKAAAKAYETVPQLYMYAMGVTDGDSVVYISDIQTLQNVKLVRQNGFLVNRQDYSSQFRNYLSDTLQEQNRVCAVAFNKSKGAITSDYNKVKKRYAKEHLLIKTVDPSQFQFIVTND